MNETWTHIDLIQNILGKYQAVVRILLIIQRCNLNLSRVTKKMTLVCENTCWIVIPEQHSSRDYGFRALSQTVIDI